MGWGTGCHMSFLAYNGSSQKEVAPNVGAHLYEVRWTTVCEYWINGNLDDLYKSDKAFLLSCLSLSLLLHTHTNLYSHGFYVVWAKELSRKRTSGKWLNSRTWKDNFIGCSSTTMTVLSWVRLHVTSPLHDYKGMV